MPLPRLEIGAAWCALAGAVALAPLLAEDGSGSATAVAATAAVCCLTVAASMALLVGGDRASTWLCPTAADRTRMIEAGTRVNRARQIASGVLAFTLLLGLPWFGPIPLMFCAASLGHLTTLGRLIARTAHPEKFVLARLAWTAGTIAACLPWTGGPESPLIAWLALPAGLIAGRFRRRIVLTALSWCLLLLLTGTIGADLGRFLRDPTTVLAAAALLIGVIACTLALSDNEIQFRQKSRLDPLTGLLNRSALSSAMAQVEAQAAHSASAVSVVLYDLDLFKQVNDLYGHDIGDDVLLATAHVLAASARPGDAVYRLGGEEFAVVLLGTDAALALQLAERHRVAVEQSRPAGLMVTISAGVSSGTARRRRGRACTGRPTVPCSRPSGRVATAWWPRREVPSPRGCPYRPSAPRTCRSRRPWPESHKAGTPLGDRPGSPPGRSRGARGDH
jgi:diguanylate cyclase (GGDEF)-like protein